jgi:flagellar protein FlbD
VQAEQACTELIAAIQGGLFLIKVTRINGKELIVNAELIEFIESTPDTVISLTTGKKMVVSESTEELVNRIKEYKSSISMPKVVDDRC